MMTMIARNKKRRPFFGLLNSEESQRKAKEHLKSLGYDFDKQPKLVWPEGAVAAWNDHFYGQWQFRFMSDVQREKKEEMEQNLMWKRDSDKTEIRALYVWVFWCPGISGFFFKGLWTYIRGIGREYHGGGIKGNLDGHLLDEVMELFPLVDRPLFPDWRYYDRWQKQFIKKYPAKTKWCGKPQGKSAVWAEVKGTWVNKIIARAEWPQSKK